LDPLGNLVNVEVPLTGLQEERVVVKKFVYDNDELETPPVVETIPVVKNTRSRKGKGKS
jgi:hypothetical protein